MKSYYIKKLKTEGRHKATLMLCDRNLKTKDVVYIVSDCVSQKTQKPLNGKAVIVAFGDGEVIALYKNELLNFSHEEVNKPVRAITDDEIEKYSLVEGMEFGFIQFVELLKSKSEIVL